MKIFSSFEEEIVEPESRTSSFVDMEGEKFLRKFS